MEGNPEERSSVVHNELERMRRRVMRHLFANLQNCIARVPSSPLLAEATALPKITILSAVSFLKKWIHMILFILALIVNVVFLLFHMNHKMFTFVSVAVILYKNFK